MLLITSACMSNCVYRVQDDSTSEVGVVHEKSDVRVFRLFLTTYFYHPNKELFVPLPGMPGHLPNLIANALAALHCIQTAGMCYS